MDILEPLPHTKNENVFNTIMTDQYLKMKTEIPTWKTTAMHGVNDFLDHWIVPYGLPDHLPTDNDLQFIGKFSETIYGFLSVRLLIPIAHHTQKNRIVVVYNKKVVTRLWNYLTEHQDNCDI